MSWLPKKSVIVPFDFSEEAMPAIKEGKQLVGDVSNLHVLHVLPTLSATDPGVVWGTVDDTQRIDHVKEALEKSLAEIDCTGATTHVIIGDAGREVAKFAEAMDAEIIVLTSQGRSGLAHMLIGSTAERIIRLAHCPVLVLRS